MSYEKEIETRLIKIKHKIIFRNGTSITDFLNDLANIPVSSVINGIDEVNDKCILIWNEEKKDNGK